MRTLLGTTAIAAALMLSAPAFAQQSPYDQNPTPQERQQTDQLNDNAVQDSQADDAAPIPPNQADYNNNKAEYDRRMQQYNLQREAYERDRARYHAERADYAHHWDVFYGYRGFRGVDMMAGSELVGLRVDTRGGNVVGHIRAVDTDSAGHITRIAISMGDRRAWIDADDLRYDPVSGRVMTDLSRNQIDGMAHYPRY